MTEWKECLLGDIIIFQRGHDLPKSKMTGSGYPVVGSHGIIGFHNEYTTDAPSITVGRSGNVGKPYIVYGKSWSHNTSLYIKEFKNVDPIFIYYFLKTLDLGNYAGGSAVPTLNRNHIHSLGVRVPTDVSIQIKIADTLKMLDDKINENNKVNKNLEQQAEAIFQSTISNATTIVNLGEIADVKGGKRLPKGVNLIDIPNTHPYIRVRDLNNALFASLTPDYAYVDEETQKSISRYIVFTGDVLISIVGTIGLTAIVDSTLDKANLTENCVKVTNLKHVTSEYLLLYLRSRSGKEAIAKGTVGAVQQKLPIKNIQAIPVPLLSEADANSLFCTLDSIFAVISSNIIQSATLASLRDTLLPRLMSGELDVSALDI